MAKVSPIYSVKLTDRRVYHNNNNCNERNNIEKENIRNGTDNRPVCDHCDRLNQQER